MQTSRPVNRELGGGASSGLRRLRTASWLGLGLLASGASVGAQPSFEGVEQAIALIAPVGDVSKVRGKVIFTPGEGRVDVLARIEGLPSGTRHGFHIHVFGDCSDVLTGSAGPHFDPTGNMMRMTSTGMLPLGDLEDIRADAEGKAEVRFSARGLSIAGPENAILGRGLLLHESFSDPNDPMSSSGDAIACGTIGVYNKERQKRE